MKSVDKIQQLITKFGDSLKDTFTSLHGWLSMVFGAVIFTDKLELIAFFFVAFLLLDYATGIFASWVEHKNDPARNINVYHIESEKLRASGVKIIGYGLIMMFAYFLNAVVFQNHLKILGYTPPMSVFEIALLGCAVIEFWSNIENVKRAGFDIIGKFTTVVKSIWLAVRQMKGEKE